MLYQVTNKGPARTVDFLGTFAEGEMRKFNQAEMENYQNFSGVPVFSGPLSNEDEFDVVVITESKEGR
jgi:hypothetical protein